MSQDRVDHFSKMKSMGGCHNDPTAHEKLFLYNDIQDIHQHSVTVFLWIVYPSLQLITRTKRNNLNH